jgi:hypothetical protein
VSTLRRMHVSNADQRNAVIVASSARLDPGPVLGKDGKAARFSRFIAAGTGRLDPELRRELGDDYAQALIDGDPEIDLEVVGKFIEGTQSMLISSEGAPLFTAPRIVEITYDPEGEEIDRRAPVEIAATVNDAVPLRWTGRKMPKGEVVRKFSFRRSLQLQHVDGVTFDFLYGMAKELADENVMVLLGAGAQGKDPIIMQVNGSPYRGFLEGRVNGDEYLLLLHLSNMELKKPEAVAASTEGES